MSDLEDYVRNKEIKIEKVSKIRQHQKSEESESFRSEADRDYARIIYSSSFRRLQGKMQLLIPNENFFYRNRLTHSLEVSQIAKTLASRLKMNDVTTVQTCSLAHDIGNSPFGHHGERVLNKLDKNNHYEGNAQTFRTLTHLEEKFHDCNGLDLTIRTILGVVKYFNKRRNYSQFTTLAKEKFLYDNDYNLVKDWCIEYSLEVQTIDCEVMNLSDEIAYAAHDLEDCLKLKVFNIDEIIYELKISGFSDAIDKFEELVKNARDYSNNAKTYDTSEEYSIYFLKRLTSSIIDTLVRDIGVIVDNGIVKLEYQNYGSLSKGLKKVVFKALSRDKRLYEYEKMGEKVIRGLYEVLTDKSYNKDQKLLPAEYRTESNKNRTVLDYIGGMMDSYAIDSYKKYFGQNSLDGLYYKV